MSIEKCANKIYYNASMTNNGTNIVELAEHDVTRTRPILDKPEDYYMSIIRFNVQARSIPIFIWYTTPNTTDTLLELSFRYNPSTNVYTRTVEYFPETTRNTPPTTWSATDNWFWSFSYQHICDVLNATLVALMADLNLAEGTAYTPPFFEFNVNLQRFQINIPESMNIPGTDIDFFVNERGTYIVEAFPSIHNLDSNTLFTQLIYVNNGTNLVSKNTGGGAVNYYVLTEEYSNFSNINSIGKIFFTSASLPIEYEWTQGVNNTGTSTSEPIIFDLMPLLETPGAERSQLSYFQNGPYRLIDMKGTVPLYRMQFKIWWQDYTGTNHPLELFRFSNANVKIAFIKKDTFTS